MYSAPVYSPYVQPAAAPYTPEAPPDPYIPEPLVDGFWDDSLGSADWFEMIPEYDPFGI
jgi:hypothetical protein